MEKSSKRITHRNILRFKRLYTKDYIQTITNNLNGRIGKMIILSSIDNFVTYFADLINKELLNPRNMLQNYQDAMTIVDKFDKPDLFITMICNPK